MALENSSKNYIRISKVELDYKSLMASVHLEFYASENIRNNEKVSQEQKNKLVLRFNELSLKGESVYKTKDLVINEVKRSPEIQEIIKNSANLDEINKAIENRVDEEMNKAHISGRTYEETTELLAIDNELNRIASLNIMTNTVIIVIAMKDIVSKETSDIRDSIYTLLHNDPRYRYIWDI